MRSGCTHLELRTDAGGFLLFVQVQEGFCGSIMQGHAYDELQRFGIQQVLEEKKVFIINKVS